MEEEQIHGCLTLVMGEWFDYNWSGKEFGE